MPTEIQLPPHTTADPSITEVSPNRLATVSGPPRATCGGIHARHCMALVRLLFHKVDLCRSTNLTIVTMHMNLLSNTQACLKSHRAA
mgnify:CR=1 FL=1